MFDSLYKNERFSSSSSVHLPLQIKQFNHDKSFQAFFYYNQDLTVLVEKVYNLYADFLNILHNVPPIVMQQFSLSCLIDEVHSTSSIEGIHSTHRELKEILDGNYNRKHFSSIIKKYDLLLSGHSPLFFSCEDVRNFYEDFAHADAIAENPKNRLDGKLFRNEAVDIHSPTGKIIHRGITPEAELIDALSIALDFLNYTEHPVLLPISTNPSFAISDLVIYIPDGTVRKRCLIAFIMRLLKSSHIAKYAALFCAASFLYKSYKQ